MGRLPTSERPRSLSLGAGAVRFSAPCGKSIACHTDNTSGYGVWVACRTRSYEPPCPTHRRERAGSTFPQSISVAMVDGTLRPPLGRSRHDAPDCGNGVGSKTWDEPYFFG